MKTITVKNLDGTNESVEIVYYFDIKDLNKTFAIISKGEKLKEGMSKVYISEVTEEEAGIFKFIAITDESVWDSVKGAMKAVIQGNKLESSKNISGVVELLGSRVIGIKDTDKEKFASMSLESSFTIENPVQDVVSAPVENSVEQPSVNETVTENVNVEPVKEEVKDEVKEEVSEPVNIFDQIAAASPVEPVVETKEEVVPPVVETPVIPNPVVETPVVETPVVETPVAETPVAPINEVPEETKSEPVFDMPEVKDIPVKEKDEINLNTCFELIKEEIIKKDKLIEEQSKKIAELESELKAYKNTNVYEAPGQSFSL